MRDRYVLIFAIALVMLGVVGSVLVVRNFKGGMIIPIGKKYGSVIFDNSPEGIKCFSESSERVELKYTAVTDTDFGKGFLTMTADEGDVADISCNVVEDSFIGVSLASPNEEFEDAGFEHFLFLAEGDSLTLQYIIDINTGKTWTDNTTKSISLYCDVGSCETTRGIGNCDFSEDVDFRHSTAYTCS